MNKGRMFHWMLLIAGAFMVGSADTALGQLLYRSQMDQEFYGWTGYNVYGRSLVNRSANPRFDELGNYVLDGVQIFSWEEERKAARDIETRDRFSHLYKTNTIDNSEYFRQYLNNLVIVNESARNFSSRFIVGNEVRVLFSPLTLDMAALNGVRWDTQFGDNSLTFVSSRADLPLWFVQEMSSASLADRVSPVIMNGAHYEREMGVLNVAANYVNTYKTNGQQARSFSASSLLSDVRNSVTGSLTDESTLEKVQYLVVKVEDGSRMDADGPRIYDMYPVIEGVEHKELLMCISRENWENDFYDAIQPGLPSKDFYENAWMLDPKRVPQFTRFLTQLTSNTTVANTQYLMYRKATTDPIFSFGKYSVDENSANAGKQYLECNGNNYLLFWFKIPETVTGSDGSLVSVKDVKFRALLGNDYKISLSEIYNDTVTSSGKSARYFTVAKEAPGNVKDMSNFGWIDFKYGVQTANMLMGLRVTSQVKGFSLIAEFNKNFGFYQYPTTDSKKFRDDADAFYINVKKDIGKFSFGTEVFNIDPNYTTEFESTDLGYDDMNNLAYQNAWASYFIPYTDNTGGSSSETKAAGYMNNTSVVNTVDDNDDKDRYPDFHMWAPLRDMNGVYPGLDENGNERPDTNENENLVPDYVEPFFLYTVDPDEYSYGDDLNNNGIVDSREDDDQPDYPYDVDTRGYHVFGQWGSDQGLKYTLGVIDYHQIAESGKTKVKYGKVEYKKFIPFFANVNFATVFKKVQDDIDDNTFRVTRELTATLHDSLTYTYNANFEAHGLISEKYYDPLDYRDSYANTSYLETKLFRIPNLTVGLKFKYSANHQNETSYQSANNIIERSQVLKVDYRYYLHDLLLMPQVKFLSRRYTNANGNQATFHEQSFYPIFRVEYPLTSKTTLKCGVQGIPGITLNNRTVIPALNSTIRDLVNDDLNYDQRDYIFMLTNMSSYNGYDFSLNLGYQLSWQKLNSEVYAPLSSSSKVLFIRVVVGMEPIS